MARFTLNGEPTAVDLPDDVSLLHALRGPFGLSGPRFGCGAEQCGTCMVLVDGTPRYACTLPVGAVEGSRVLTVEGLGTPDKPGRVQRAFIAEQAAQCGFCIPGMILQAQALLERNPKPTPAEIRSHMSGNLCRCGTHMRILRAVERASREP